MKGNCTETVKSKNIKISKTLNSAFYELKKLNKFEFIIWSVIGIETLRNRWFLAPLELKKKRPWNVKASFFVRLWYLIWFKQIKLFFCLLSYNNNILVKVI